MSDLERSLNLNIRHKMMTNFSLTQLVLTFLVLSVLSLVGFFLLIPERRQQVVLAVGGSPSTKDSKYLANTL